MDTHESIDKKENVSCKKCWERCHVDDGEYIQSYNMKIFYCHDCIKLMKQCHKCKTPTFYCQKFQNKTLHSCFLHTLRLTPICSYYICPQCGNYSSGCTRLYLCEECNSVLCKTCVYKYGRRKFDKKGKVFCIKCEGAGLLKEYEQLWKFRKRFIDVEMSKWTPVLSRYVRFFWDYKM